MNFILATSERLSFVHWIAEATTQLIECGRQLRSSSSCCGAGNRGIRRQHRQRQHSLSRLLVRGTGRDHFSLYQVSDVQPADGIQRAPNDNVSAGAQSRAFRGKHRSFRATADPDKAVTARGIKKARPKPCPQLVWKDSYSFLSPPSAGSAAAASA